MVAFGDSIANGLGSGGRSYPVLVAERLGAELTDMTGTATQIGESREFSVPHDRSRRRADRPWDHGRRSGDPARGHCGSCRGAGATRAGWIRGRITHRARGSERWSARSPSCAGGARTAAAHRTRAVVPAGGVRARVPCPCRRTARRRRAARCHREPTGDRQRFFPRSPESLAEYAEIGRRVAEETGVFFCDVATTTVRWDDYLADHFHPSPAGHERIAERILATLE